MARMLFATAWMVTLALASGCAMCENSFDEESPAFGGICEDGGCGRRAGSIIGGPCGEMVEEVVVNKGDFPEGLAPQSAEPVPAMPFDLPLEEETPLEMEYEPSITAEGGGAPMLDPPTPDPGLFTPGEFGPAEVESEGLEVPEPADASDSGLLPLGPAAAPPEPGTSD